MNLDGTRPGRLSLDPSFSACGGGEKTAISESCFLKPNSKGSHHEPRRAGQENKPTHRQVLGGRRLQEEIAGRRERNLDSGGEKVPAGLSIKAVENTDKVFHFVIPPKPELSEVDLGKVSGGDACGPKKTQKMAGSETTSEKPFFPLYCSCCAANNC